jgi:hypothetical protein
MRRSIMGRKVIVEGDTYNTTLEKGLKALGAEPGKVKVEILEEGKTMMGRVLKPYKLLLSLHKDINKEKKSTVSLFSLEYRDDGVYLIVFPSSAELTKAQEQLKFFRVQYPLSDNTLVLRRLFAIVFGDWRVILYNNRYQFRICFFQ